MTETCPLPRPRLLLASALCLFGLASCGSGWVPLTGGNSSGGGNPLEILSRDPAAGSTDAESRDEIEFSFNAEIDPVTVTLTTGSIRLYEDDPSLGAPDRFDDLVEDVTVDGSEIKLTLFEPLRLRDTYYVEVRDGFVASTTGRVFDGETWSFTVQEGALQQDELVSFLAPISGISYVPSGSLLSDSTLDAVVLLEGRDSSTSTGEEGEFVIAAAIVKESGGISNPTILQRSTLDDENTLGEILSWPTGQTTVSWQRGKPFCSGSNDRMPEAHVFLSQYTDVSGAASWEILDEDGFVDQRGPDGTGIVSSSDNWIAWLPRLAYTDAGDALATFWVWTDFDTEVEDFETWSVYSARRPAGSAAWELPVRISPPPSEGTIDPASVGSGITPGPGQVGVAPHFGWPLIQRHPTEDRIYAIFTADSERPDLYAEPGTPPQIDQLWIAVYEDGAWQPARRADFGGVFDRIGRPTSFVINDAGEAVVFLRLPLLGIGALAFDLSGAEPALLEADLFPLPAGESFWDDTVEYQPNCQRFNFNRAYISEQPPFAILLPPAAPGDSRSLVSWIGEDTGFDGSPTAQIRTVEYDMRTGRFLEDRAELVSGPIERSLDVFSDLGVSGGAAQVDQAGNVFLAWSVSESFELVDRSSGSGPFREVPFGADVSEGLIYSELQAARRDIVSEEWKPLAEALPDGDPTFSVSPALGCAIDGRLTRVHPSGRVIFSWTELECPPGATVLSSLLRRFQ